MSVDVFHYLNTFLRKPGALKNSVALKSKENLKAIFDKYYTGKAREFIGILQENADKEIPELVSILTEAATGPAYLTKLEIGSIEYNVTTMTKSQISELSRLFMGDGGDSRVS